ncbi:MAG: MATE family efflux transporter, partial [Clostridia bacterium]|nr:MATE family efflux transporter [Clostridia bacterium]
MCAVIGGFLLLTAPLFPRMYNTTEEVKALATVLLRIVALVMPLQAFNNAAYFTLRAGGQTIITFIFDSMFIWVISLPAAFYCAHFTAMGVMTMYAIVQGLESIKTTLGVILVKKGTWLSNIT